MPLHDSHFSGLSTILTAANQTQSDAIDITLPYRGHAEHFPFSAVLGRVPKIHSMFSIHPADVIDQAEENPWYAEQTPHTNTSQPMKWRKRYAKSKAYHENKQRRVDLLAVYLPRLCGSEAIMIVGRERKKQNKTASGLIESFSTLTRQAELGGAEF